MGKLGPDAQDTHTNDYRQIDASFAGGVDSPVKDEGQSEKGDEMKCLVVTEMDISEPKVRAQCAEDGKCLMEVSFWKQ